MRDAFSRTLYQIAKKMPNVFIVVSDISPAGSMAPFQAEFPDRFINVGIAEQSMIGVCAGLAARGCTAFAYTIATFAIYRPFEQVRVDLCYQHLPVTIVGIGGGVSYSALGGTHHAQEDVAVMSALPGMSVLAPCDPLETEAAALACAEQHGPCYLRLGKAGEPALTAGAPEPFRFGKVRLLKDGTDVCILSYGPIMKLVFDVAAALETKHRVSPAVYSVPTLKPLDAEGIGHILQKFGRVVVVEEHSERGGLGAQVKQLAWEFAAGCDVLTFALRDQFIHVYGSQADLWRAHGLDQASIVDRIASGHHRRVRNGGNQPAPILPAFKTPYRRAN